MKRQAFDHPLTKGEKRVCQAALAATLLLFVFVAWPQGTRCDPSPAAYGNRACLKNTGWTAVLELDRQLAKGK